MITFENLGLRDEILRAVDCLGFENPMPVQEQVIPFVMNESSDLIALAQTGTGKTAAFGFPLLNLINKKKCTQALILSPTRELCIQISNDLKNYSQYMSDIKIVPVYGGESIVSQMRQLTEQPQIIVATPGRLIDLIGRKKVKLDAVKFLILDEADEMLNMGFQEDLETILQSVPDERRTLLFSATMPKEIEQIARKYMHDSQSISIGVRNSGSDNVEHIYYMVQASNRYLALKRIVDINPDIYGIIFCRTRQETKDVAEKLMRDGYNADALHGDLSQPQRDSVMNKFRIRNIQMLVATDVAARGLDVNDLTHIINYNLPDDVEIYTHRSGRTGRANKSGISVSIVHSREYNRIREIERVVKKTFKKEQVPSGLDICKCQLFHMIERMEQVQVNDEQIDQFLPHVFKKLEYLDKEDIIRRFVSLEFNRFLDYYKNAVDLNIPDKPDYKDGKQRGERRTDNRNGNRNDNRNENRNENRNDYRSDRNKSAKRGQRMRMKIDFGAQQKASPRSVLGLINEITKDKSISINNIEVSNKFTFFDVFADQADQLIAAFHRNNRTSFSIAVAKEGNRQREYQPQENNFYERRRREFSKPDRERKQKRKRNY
ncbi:MAG: DEAD/DEAH box helicase [Prevotellaceae bacterium]|jgi:ATP-dependent RNA helicase DeaD|nr:DEAD/DEAH box helicase [Prevotellaceae bacterium]